MFIIIKMSSRKSSRKPKKRSQSNELFKNKILAPILIAFLFGGILGYAITQPQVNTLKTNEDVLESQILFLEERINELKIKESELSQSQTVVNTLQSQINSNKLENAALSEKVSLLNSEITVLENTLEDNKVQLSVAIQDAEMSEAEISKLNTRLNSITKTIEKFENDKLLLVELRKEIPSSRSEAYNHWERVKDIAIVSDPTLGPKIDKVISMIDAYYDWLDQQPGVNSTDTDFFNWIVEGNISGAINYTSEIGKFQNDALLAVIIRMDAAISLVS